MLRRAVTTLAFAALAVVGSLVPREAHAKSPYLEIPPEEEVLVAPAYRYANMTDAEAFAELDRRKIPYTKEKATPGVRAPIRLAGKLHDVWIHSSLREEERAGSVFEILDARLALALDDFSVILARHDVVEVTHYTMYRPNMPMPGTEPTASKDAVKEKQEARKPTKKSARGKGKRRASLDGKATKGPKGTRKAGSGETRRKDFELHDHEHDYLQIELASGGDDEAAKGKPKGAPKAGSGKAAGKKGAAPSKGRGAKKRILATTDEQPHGKWAPPGTRHPAGLAIDVGILKKSDGTMLHVAAHFRGKIGARTCGEGAPDGETAPAKELREIVCEAREAGVFTYALTPNFDAAHADHFHLEIKPGVKWFLFH